MNHAFVVDVDEIDDLKFESFRDGHLKPIEQKYDTLVNNN